MQRQQLLQKNLSLQRKQNKKCFSWATDSNSCSAAFTNSMKMWYAKDIKMGAYLKR